MPRNDLIQVRSDTSSNWTSVNPTLATGEIGFETNTGKFKIGTGSTAWSSLPYTSDTAGSATTAGTVTTAAQPAITSVGTLTGLTVDGASSPSFTIGDWAPATQYSGITGNTGYLLVGTNAADNAMYLRTSTAGAVNIGASGSNTLSVGNGTATLNGTLTATLFSGSGASLTSIPNSATTATSANDPSKIVARDASGDFSARVIVATTYAGAGRGVGIAGGPGDTPAILQFLNNAGNAQWSSLVATNNLLTVTTPIASSSFVGNVTGSSGSCTGNSATTTLASNSTHLQGYQLAEANTPYTIVLRGFGGDTALGDVSAKRFEASNSNAQFYSLTTFTSLGLNCARVENGYPVYDKLITNRPVYINSTGTLGTLSSSRVYKENIVDYHDATNKILTLNPVTFDFRQEFIEEGDDRFNHFGLIAEDVHDAGLTHLVSYNAEGQPKAVDYTMLSVELLGIVKKQQTAIDDLLARVQALETL